MAPLTQMNSKSPTIRRILREASEMCSAPSPDYCAEPLESDLFEWHFTLRGPPNSVFSEGIYHGRITLPNTYPLRPPNFRFTTPNGRFEVNREICLSISGHHEETWQPAWGIRTAIVALRSFMETDAKGQLGGLDSPDVARRHLASQSGSFTCSTCSKTNRDIMRESAEQANQLNSVRPDTETPVELSFGWRDELEKASPQEHRPELELPGLKRENPDTLEGSRSTQPISTTSTETQTVRSRVPTSGIATGSQVGSDQQAHRVREPGISPLIDRAIVILSIILFFLLIKVLLGV